MLDASREYAVMTLHDLSSEELIDLVTRYQVVEPEPLWQYLAARGGGGSLPPDAREAAADMVRAGLLTPFQAERLLASDGRSLALVGLDRSHATNSGCVFGEPPPHLLIGPGPLEGVGVELVVLRHRGQRMPDQLLPSHPGATPEVAAPERTDQHLRLVHRL